MQDDNSGFYWIYHPNIFTAWDGLPTISGARLHLSGLTKGRYRVEFWNTLDGKMIEARNETLGPDTDILLPPVPKDLAMKVQLQQ